MTDPFISTDDLEAATGESALEDNALATIILDSACEIVRGYIDNQVNLTEETITLDGNGRGRLVLPRPPVREIVEIVEDDVEVDPTDYVLEAAGIIRRTGDVWSRGFGNLSVTYVHGWDVAEPDDPEYTPDDFERVPSDLRSVALGLAKRRFEAAGSVGGSAGAVIEESIGGGDYRYKLSEGALAATTSQTLIDDERAILDRYRAPVNL